MPIIGSGRRDVCKNITGIYVFVVFADVVMFFIIVTATNFTSYCVTLVNNKFVVIFFIIFINEASGYQCKTYKF